MAAKRCCCDCSIASDDFNRADSGNPGSGWSEIGSADWDISSNTLVEIVEGPLITTAQGARLGPKGYYAVVVDFTLVNIGTGPGQISDFGIIVGYEDVNNFDWVRIVYDGADLWPSFIRRASGSDTVLMDKTTHSQGVPFAPDVSGTTWDGRICYAPNDWTLNSQTPEEYSWTTCDAKALTSQPIGLGLVGFLRGEFDDWVYENHWEAMHSCDRCSCWCQNPNAPTTDYRCFPETLHATFTAEHNPALYSCPEVDGVTIDLKQRDWTAPPEAKWSPTKKYWVSDNVPIGEPVEMVFDCEAGPGLRWDSNVFSWDDATAMTDFKPADWAISTCNAISIVFHSLVPDENTCDYFGATGVQAAPCPTGDCLEDTSANHDLIASLRWRITVTS